MHSTDDYVVVQSLVAAGAAVTVLPDPDPDRDPDPGLAAHRHLGVRVLPLTDHSSRVVSARLHADARGNSAVGATITHLRQAASEQPATNGKPHWSGLRLGAPQRERTRSMVAELIDGPAS